MADLTTVVVGDSAVQIAASDAAKLESFKASTLKAMADAKAEFTTAIEAKDKELAAKDAQLEDAKSKILDDAAKAKMVSDRVALEQAAMTIDADVKPSGLTDADLRKAVVAAKLGVAAVADKSDAYIDARFDILAEDAAKEQKSDPLRKTLKSADKAVIGDAVAEREKAFADNQAYLNNAYKGEAA